MLDQNLRDWIDQADTPRHKKERQVIHIILNAVSKINTQFQVALKGGVLIALVTSGPEWSHFQRFNWSHPGQKTHRCASVSWQNRRSPTIMAPDF